MSFLSIQEIPTSKIKTFKSTNDELNVYFHAYAKRNDSIGIGKTFVYYEDNVVKGYATLSNAQINFEEVPPLLKFKLPRYPIPCVRIARLAVDQNYKHQGIGSSLLKECLLRIVAASTFAGIYFVILDAKDDAVTFYEQFGFQKIVPESNKLIISIVTLQKAISKAQKD